MRCCPALEGGPDRPPLPRDEAFTRSGEVGWDVRSTQPFRIALAPDEPSEFAFRDLTKCQALLLERRAVGDRGRQMLASRA